MQRIAALEQEISVAVTGARTTEDVFTGQPHWMPSGRIFGGQVVAQALRAAEYTIDDDRPAHSLHAYFLRPGDTGAPLTYSVDRIHDGRSFSTRRTQAYQDGVPILSMIASFQHRDDTDAFQTPMPEDIPDPEELPTIAELTAGLPDGADVTWARERPVDVRHVGGPIYLSVSGDRVPHQAVWMRANTKLPDSLSVQRAALAYASDLSLLEPILRGLGVPWATPGLKIASLDHVLWFHRDGRVDDWLLYVQEATSAVSSRGLAHGRFYTRDGVHIASVAQEGLVRVPRRTPSS
ncbi:MAG TPA: acyl-CoA thioesterase II [Microbacteriaceae bacterium]|nr:acyl-CoA thioesterase II [Microbacteriaceae bacterium]